MPKPSEPKPCPFCGQNPSAETYSVTSVTYVQCTTPGCLMRYFDWVRAEQWNSRPIEDALTQRINDLESALHATATGKR